jgi:hypothetical protein
MASGFVSYRSFVERGKSMRASYSLGSHVLDGVVRAVVSTEKSLRGDFPGQRPLARDGDGWQGAGEARTSLRSEVYRFIAEIRYKWV